MCNDVSTTTQEKVPFGHQPTQSSPKSSSSELFLMTCLWSVMHPSNSLRVQCRTRVTKNDNRLQRTANNNENHRRPLSESSLAGQQKIRPRTPAEIQGQRHTAGQGKLLSGAVFREPKPAVARSEPPRRHRRPRHLSGFIISSNKSQTTWRWRQHQRGFSDGRLDDATYHWKCKKT